MPRDLKADLGICDKATPGPWGIEYRGSGKPPFYYLWRCDKDGILGGLMNMLANIYYDGDAQFIAAAREGWPEAIERALRAEAQVAKIQGIVDNIKENLECSKYPCSFNSSLICTHKTCPYREVRNILVEAEQEAADD